MREITIRLPFLLPTRNQQDRMHYHEKRKLKDQIIREFLVAGIRRGGPEMQYAEVSVWRHSTSEPDVDGLYGSVKQLLDVIQPEGAPCLTKKAGWKFPNPGALNIIANDSPAHIVLRPFWVKAKRLVDQHTVVRIRELESSEEVHTMRQTPTDGIALPLGWLARAVKLLNELAGEGICILDQADPADLMCDLVDHNNLGAADDPWAELVARLAEK